MLTRCAGGREEAQGDTIGCMFDAAAGTFEFTKNGTAMGALIGCHVRLGSPLLGSGLFALPCTTLTGRLSQ
jgi:hypothetical protein